MSLFRDYNVITDILLLFEDIVTLMDVYIQRHVKVTFFLLTYIMDYATWWKTRYIKK